MGEKKVETQEIEESLPQVINVVESSVDSVKAELVRMHQSAANRLIADEVELHQSAAQSVTADKVSAHDAGFASVQAGQVSITQGSIALARASEIHMSGTLGVGVADTIEVQGKAGALVGRIVQAENVRSGILIARQVNGSVETLIDTRSAVLAGLVGGMIAGIFYLAGSLLKRRKS